MCLAEENVLAVITCAPGQDVVTMDGKHRLGMVQMAEAAPGSGVDRACPLLHLGAYAAVQDDDLAGLEPPARELNRLSS